MSDYDDDEYGDEYGEEGAEEYVELDLERTLTWTSNAVTVQAGGEFRMPLLVPHPSVLAIQFEVENGQDIEFSLLFKDDKDADKKDGGGEASLLVEPVRVSDREGQLDIDTTGQCEIVWSNAHAWMTTKTVSYQLQLAPKVDMVKKKWRVAVVTAAGDFKMLAAAQSADRVEQLMRDVGKRKKELAGVVKGTPEKTAHARLKHEKYLGHVRRLEEEAAAARAHADAAAAELSAIHKEAANAERTLNQLASLASIDDGLTEGMRSLIARCEDPLMLIYDAYAGCMYDPPDDDDDDDGHPSDQLLDRAELLHFLQDFEIIGRGDPEDMLCGVFSGCPQQLSRQEYARCLQRTALGLMPYPPDRPDAADDELREMLLQVPANIERVRLTALDVPRRAKVLHAAELIDEAIGGD